MKKILVFILLTISFTGFSQEEEAPKIGLVLSGGGAKGLAHIGVLKVLEEAGVQIDYIGGTSMGAIVGGLYAAGYSASQLDSIFEATNFNILIQDALPRNVKSFHEKRDSERYALSLPFDNFNISFPSGLSRGQNVYNLMSRLTHHVDYERNFGNLPIPFFCVAADVETGEEVILDKGYLPQAISASAAIPTLFSPVLIDGRVLSDGGIVNNYPVEELKRRGADIIIGVDVQDELVDRDDLNSVFEILTQVSNFRTVADMKEKVGKTDIYIDPPIGPYGVTSFNRGRELIKLGEESAREKIEEFRELAARQKPREIERQILPASDSLNITDIRIEGNHTYPRSYVLGKLKLKDPEKTTYEELGLGINNLSATGNFRKINYKLLPLNEGYVLVLQLEENSNKMSLRLGVHYDELYKIGALVNITRNSLFLTNDVASLDLIVGDNSRYNFRYYIDKGYYWSIGLNSRYNRFRKDMRTASWEESGELSEIDVNRLAIDYQDFTSQFYVETLFEKVFSIGAGMEHKYLKVDSETIASSASPGAVTVFDKNHYWSTFGYLKYDSYDNKYYPRRGLFFDGDFHFYFLGSDYNKDFAQFSIAKGELGYAITPLPHFTTRFSAGAGFHIGSSANKSLDFFLGGYGNDFINNIVPFLGYDFLDISADSYFKGMIELDYEIFSKNHLLATANFANLEDSLFVNGDWLGSPNYSGYALGYGIETFMGPLEVRYSYSPELESSRWYFSLGFWF